MNQESSGINEEKFDSFSLEIGERIRQARLDLGLSQTELADKISKKQTSVSEFERGKIDINASTLLKLALALGKPVSYFFPQWIHSIVQPEKLSPLEAELLSIARKLNDNDLRRTIIQLRALVAHDRTQYDEFLEEQKREIDPSDI